MASVCEATDCRGGEGYHGRVAVTTKKLDVKIGDLVEIEGRTYDVVSDKQGGVTLEPAITVTADELFADHGLRPLTPEEFEEEFGDLKSDGEG